MALLDRLRLLVRRPPDTSSWVWFATLEGDPSYTWTWFQTLDGGASWTWFQTFTVAWFCTLDLPEGCRPWPWFETFTLAWFSTLTFPRRVKTRDCPTCGAHYPTDSVFTEAARRRDDWKRSPFRQSRFDSLPNDPFYQECNDCAQAREDERAWRKTSARWFDEFDSGDEHTPGYGEAVNTLDLMKRVRAHLATLDPEPAPTTTASAAVALGEQDDGQPVTITAADRNRHVYMIGKTGSGKSSLLRNVIMQDLAAGRGVIYLDPHGDTAQTLLGYVPPERAQDVVYFCPVDETCPSFNLLAAPYPADKLTRDVVSAFRMFFGFDQTSAPRLSQLLQNTVLLLLLDREHERHSLADVQRLLRDPDYRNALVARCPHESVKQFWTLEFPRFPKDAALPVLNKFSDLLMPLSPMERIFSSTDNALDLTDIMNGGKILLVNLSKGELGEAGAFLIGALIVTAVNQAALARARIPEHERRDVFLYVDEFQNFVVDSFESILSEARKYRLNLTLAHQYLAQVPANLRSAIFGNVAVSIALPISAEDATTMQREFGRLALRSKSTGDVFDPVSFFRDRAKRFLDGVTLRRNQHRSHTGELWPAHITQDAYYAGQNCLWFLNTYMRTRRGTIPDGLTQNTWPTTEDFKLLSPLSGFVKINKADNVHRFTIHHPKEKPSDKIRNAILERQQLEHEARTRPPTPATSRAPRQSEERPHQKPQDARTATETTQTINQESTKSPDAPGDDFDEFLT